MDIVFFTSNKNKLKEINEILAGSGLRVISPADLGLTLDVVEDGDTFAANAIKKAQACAQATGLISLADDSGLEIDYLDKAPGVYSARYMGDAPQSEKNAALLKELESIPESERSARFIASICCMIDENTIITCEGVCEGKIAYAPEGSGGFGYDPIFTVNGKSFALLTGDEKDKLSHRGKAMRELADKLVAYLRLT